MFLGMQAFDFARISP